MKLTEMLRGLRKQLGQVLTAILVSPLLAGMLWAQMTATMSGSIKDTSGAIVPEATVTVKHLDTGLIRSAQTDERGTYRLLALPVGQYEVTAERSGFKTALRRGITLVVAQEAVVDVMLEVGSVEQQVTVTAEAPLVNTTVSSTAGLVGEKQVKDLPLNGRSFDQLLTLNAGTTDYSSNASRNSFSVSGRRPDENRFSINGIEFIGNATDSQWHTPVGSSGQLLGVDAVREFNVQTDAYSAEYGKKAGGQIAIVTNSGANQVHGSLFHYIRNNALDTRNFFDRDEPAPFKRNQFGGTLGGPIKRDKLFLFGSYEGFRQRLQSSGQVVVPDLNIRKGLMAGPNNTIVPVPDLQPRMLGYMALWKEPNGPSVGGEVALRSTDTVQAIREDLGLLRVDYTLSEKDFLSGTFLKDDGNSSSPSSSTYTTSSSNLRHMVAGLQATRVISATLLNVATLGVSRGYGFTQPTFDLTSFPDDLRMVRGMPGPGQIRIGGSTTGGVTIASAGGPATGEYSSRTLYTISDDVRYTRGIHSMSFGAWVQRVHDNNAQATALGGIANYSTFLTMLQDRPQTFQGSTRQVSLGYRYTHFAYYLQDEMKVRPNLTLRLGLRDEMTSGWNEVNCRASNYWFDNNGDILTEPHVGCSILKENKATLLALLQPRVSLAWDPTGTGSWAVRAAFGVHKSIQNIFGWRLTNYPHSGIVFYQNTPLLSLIPLPDTDPLPPCTPERQAARVDCRVYAANGVEPSYPTPTVQEWNFVIERQLATNLMLRVGYNGSQAYHSMTNAHYNTARSVICENPAGCTSGGAGTARGIVPQGKEYLAPGPVPNPYVGSTFTFAYGGTSNYHGLDVTLQQRLSHGLAFRMNYTFSKAIDLNSAPAGSASTNAPAFVAYRYNLGLSRGTAAFSATNKFNANFSYELPLGRGKLLGSGATGFWSKLISEWQWNGILTVRDGFPFSPIVGRNISGTGDTRAPDVPDINPNFSGPVVTGTVAQWFDPRAYQLPIPGTFGNAGKGRYTGPGLFNLDTSLFKRIGLSENWNVQFRFEAFNILNHTNLGSPLPTVFSGNNIASTAGRITDTATKSRQLQFALRLTF